MKTVSYTFSDDFIEGFLKDLTLLPFSHPGFTECRVIRNRVI